MSSKFSACITSCTEMVFDFEKEAILGNSVARITPLEPQRSSQKTNCCTISYYTMSYASIKAVQSEDILPPEGS